MNTVEFRAWEKEEKKMYHDVGIVGTLIILEHEQRGYDFCEADLTLYDQLDNKYDLMQYTGIKDKNGKKIFKGDIVKDHGDCLYIVEWDEKDAMFYYKDSYGYEDDDLRMSAVSFEVVGNIYENPELLKN
ncbi:YopX family protein [Bacillus luti]|uniref:YopX family protein n=1 Tax=Bacillus luti TaxID=2026191 RepID=UPI0028997A6D|nr:YopX family protein [Bacillus luti]